MAKYKCVMDCWVDKDPYGVKLYVQGFEYEMDKDHPCAIHFVDLETGKRLKEPPIVIKSKKQEDDPDVLRGELAEVRGQLLELLAISKEKEEKRGPGRPSKSD